MGAIAMPPTDLPVAQTLSLPCPDSSGHVWWGEAGVPKSRNAARTSSAASHFMEFKMLLSIASRISRMTIFRSPCWNRIVFLFFLPAFCLLMPHVLLAQGDGTRLAPLYAAQVDKKLDIPEADQHFYADLLGETLGDRTGGQAQYVVLVDRNDFVQAAMIYWMSPDGQFHFIGASPVSTGKPGRYEHFVTPTGVFEHTTDNPDFRSKGTFNRNHIRGYGAKGMRVYDFGWQPAIRGWGKGGEGKLRLQMHATDPDRLAQKLGTPQSEGCIRIPATLNTFIDHYGILDGDYEKAMAEGQTFWVLSKTREATSWSGRFLVVVDSGRTERASWDQVTTLEAGAPKLSGHAFPPVIPDLTKARAQHRTILDAKAND